MVDVKKTGTDTSTEAETGCLAGRLRTIAYNYLNR